MSTVTEKKIETPVLRCPKNMKLPKAVKVMAALMGKSKETQNFLMRSMGIAISEQALKTKSTQRDAPRDRQSNIPSSGPAA